MMRKRTMWEVGGAPEQPYVEIAGIKWATMNIGANSETDYGLYFHWGDTAGYTESQVGSSSTANKKPFYWNDCVLHNGIGSGNATDFTKYNSNDGLTELEPNNDAAVANWGGYWRMPTTEEFAALGNATTTEWVTSYNGVSVAGRLVTDRTDSSKKLFFPAAGYCHYGSVYGAGSYGIYWSSSLDSSNVRNAHLMFLASSYIYWQYNNYRYIGCPVRPVLDDLNNN